MESLFWGIGLAMSDEMGSDGYAAPVALDERVLCRNVARMEACSALGLSKQF